MLQEKEVRRIGDDRTIPIDVRIIAATNRDLLRMIEENQFRKDLYYRLNILQLFIPPLSKRKEDIIEIFNYYLRVYSHTLRKSAPKLTSSEEQVLVSHTWKGNIRELNNVAERFMILYSEDENAALLLATCLNPEANEGGMLLPETPAEVEPVSAAGSGNTDGFSSHSGSSCGSDSLGNSYNYGNTCDAVNTAPSSRELILKALSEHRSQRAAAAALHISRTTLWRRMKELGIKQC